MEIEAGGPRDEPQQSLLRFRVWHNYRRKPNDPQRADKDPQLKMAHNGTSNSDGHGITTLAHARTR
eukprot:COSAG02_NODE_558_length_20348_cov_6.479431_9_plen_66_part_00